jgi:hypothetical protein
VQHEVWLIDQSDTRADGGGTLYIFDGESVAGEGGKNHLPEVIDLGADARDQAILQTGSAPRRPHMIFFNTAQTHAVVAWVVTGHVTFFDAVTRAPLHTIDVGAQAHAAVPTADQKYVIVANQNGKLLHRISTDYANNAFVLDPAATLDFVAGVTPNGIPRQEAGVRPDNAPICIGIGPDSRSAFVTLRGGGLFVVDVTTTPMSIIAEYDMEHIHPHGCGGVYANGKMYVNAGAGATPGHEHESVLYSFRIDEFPAAPAFNLPNTPVPVVAYQSEHAGEADAHGATLTRGGYLWMADREANLIAVIDTETDTLVSEFSLENAVTPDPAPDLMALAPSGNRAYISLRGPFPQSGAHLAIGSTPGLGVLRVQANGRAVGFQSVIRVSHPAPNGAELADPHAIAVRSVK